MRERRTYYLNHAPPEAPMTSAVLGARSEILNGLTRRRFLGSVSWSLCWLEGDLRTRSRSTPC